MFHLIYTSRQAQPFPPADLKKLLMNARLRNREVAVTGMLVYHDGMFLQALEGEEADVLGIYARIGKDPRHHELQVLHRNSSLGKRRMFGEWSMGFADATGAAQLLKGFVNVPSGASLSALDGTAAMDLLKAGGQAALA